MGKAGRIACIFTPWALTIASFVCLILIELSGWQKGSPLGEFYFMKANFTGLDVSSASTADNTTTLTAALTLAKNDKLLREIYEIHLWNYCSSNSSSGTIDYCSGRHADYYFDILDVWGLNSTNATSTTTPTVSGSNPLSSAVNGAVGSATNDTEQLENDLLGKTGKDALVAYKAVSKWMFIAYEISFWTTLATIVCGVLAIFSRIGSFFTWLFSIISSAFTFAAVLTSTVLFAALTGALEGVLHPYGIKIHMGQHALVVTWLSVLFSWAATLFWLFSVCCCSGRSNPHHKSNKGGLWQAEQKGQGYGEYGYGRGRGLRVEKTGGGYERVASPFLGHAEDEHGDRVPLQQYPGAAGHSRNQSTGVYEPFRHS